MNFKKIADTRFKLYKKQRNFCSILYKKERKRYYEMLDLKNVTDNKNSGKLLNHFYLIRLKLF